MGFQVYVCNVRYRYFFLFHDTFLSSGCVGGVLGLANVLGEETCRLAQLAQTDDAKAAMDLQLRLVGPNTCVSYC